MVKSTSRRIKSIKQTTRWQGRAPQAGRAGEGSPKSLRPSSRQIEWVFGLGNGKAEGRADMRDLLEARARALPRWPISACRYRPASP